VNVITRSTLTDLGSSTPRLADNVTHLSANGFNDNFARRPTLPFKFKSYVHLSHDRSYAFASFRDQPNKPLEWTGYQNLHGLYPILCACHSGAAFEGSEARARILGIRLVGLTLH
jgi:hypothetical protein